MPQHRRAQEEEQEERSGGNTDGICNICRKAETFLRLQDVRHRDGRHEGRRDHADDVVDFAAERTIEVDRSRPQDDHGERLVRP